MSMVAYIAKNDSGSFGCVVTSKQCKDQRGPTSSERTTTLQLYMRDTIGKYRISSYSFRGNYSFLNFALCTVTFDHST